MKWQIFRLTEYLSPTNLKQSCNENLAKNPNIKNYNTQHAV